MMMWTDLKDHTKNKKGEKETEEGGEAFTKQLSIQEKHPVVIS